ncbi:MAG: ComF family protein [Candidatus Thiodiazotropha sp.]
MSQGIFSRLIPHLFPQRCLLCGGPGDFFSRFCSDCYQELPFNHHACRRCALPLSPGTPSDVLCGQCQKHAPSFDSAMTALRYEAPTRHLISALKFNQQLHLAPPLARLLIARLGRLDKPPDRILPVPLHTTRLRERGFNQAVELGRTVSRHYAIPLDLNSVVRTRNTRAQSDLKETDRQRNLRKAFRIQHPVRGLNLVILDDVITTAATVGELGRTLKQAGAGRVDVWAIARTERS